MNTHNGSQESIEKRPKESVNDTVSREKSGNNHTEYNTSDKPTFACPMHPEEHRDSPGMCGVCHMALEKQQKKEKHTGHDHSDHDTHAGHSTNMFKQKFWLSLFLTIPILYFSETIQDLLGFQAVTFGGSEFVSAIFGVFIFFYGGLVFLRSAKAELAMRQPGMMTLISSAISVAFIYSSLITLGILEGKDFWWELASLITIMLLGHWLEMASVTNAQGALKELAKLLPDEAELVTKDGTKSVPVAELKVGAKVLVRPGASIPADGVVSEGQSKVNEAMMTGESKPVGKQAKDHVIGGTINGSGSLTITISSVGEDTALSGIMKLVAEAQASKSRTQLLADTAAKYLFYYALIAALTTTIAWTALGSQDTCSLGH